MLTWNSMWPPTSGEDAGRAALWDPAQVFELQTRFWNQFIDASRGFWSLYTAAFPGLAWPQPGAAETEAAVETTAEPDVVSEAESVLEAQTRLWNHFLDANRNLWSAAPWTLPNGPWAGVSEVATMSEAQATPAKPKAAPPARRASAAASKSGTAARKR